GDGSEVVGPYEMGQGVIIAFVRYEGDGPFSMTFVDEDQAFVKSIESSPGPYAGERVHSVFTGNDGGLAPGNYMVNIEGSGPWRIRLFQERAFRGQLPEITLTGTGDGGGSWLQLDEGEYTMTTSHAGAADFLATVADMVGGGGALLIGVDLKKDQDILVRAYDDAEGVTAAFNRNLLERINRELGGCFDIETFCHRALYNGAEGRIEMHLVSMKDQTVTVNDRDFTFTEGETIHTENSYKYHVEEFSSLAAGAGFRTARTWVDGDGLFSLHYLTLG
ncbi:MAG: L-histidine N(alpha)-methyltransferase, partial [Proteobacteria bacterium]|nr:L-histidine N(alpha)-methyltransferase [Pseudomonadota bacterium]